MQTQSKMDKKDPHRVSGRNYNGFFFTSCVPKSEPKFLLAQTSTYQNIITCISVDKLQLGTNFYLLSKEEKKSTYYHYQGLKAHQQQ
jgi:hypothetical protein